MISPVHPLPRGPTLQLPLSRQLCFLLRHRLHRPHFSPKPTRRRFHPDLDRRHHHRHPFDHHHRQLLQRQETLALQTATRWSAHPLPSPRPLLPLLLPPLLALV
ncbi:unnamed protein product, partial [Ectocarpus sp. 8 AP-2014]